MENPHSSIPKLEKSLDSYSVIPEFYEYWNCDGFRICENELDLAHPTFVHTGTFGSESGIEPQDEKLTKLDNGLNLSAKLTVTHPEEQKKNTQLNQPETVRLLDIDWIFPLTIRLSIEYQNGINHVVCMNPVPIDEKRCFIVQFCLRNDAPDKALKKSIVDFDRRVTLEDKTILESIDRPFLNELEDAFHLKTDSPGKIIRTQLLNKINNIS